MHTGTGEIFRGLEIEAAKLRGEPIVEVSEQVAQIVEAGVASLNRKERRRQAALARNKKGQ